MPERSHEVTVTICGTNNFLISQRLNEEKKRYLTDYGDMSVEQIDCEEIDFPDIVSAAGSLPFLVPKKLLVLRNPSKNKELIEKIESILESVPERTKIILVDSKLDKRLSFYKTLKTRTEYHEFNEMAFAELVSWVIDYASSEGGKISSTDAQYLVGRVGENQNKLANEINKLVTYETNITKSNIDKLSVKSIKSSIFDLIKSSIIGDTKKALQLYEEQRLLNVEAQQIIAMLAWQLNILAILKTAKDLSINEVAAKSKVSPYSLSQSRELASTLTFPDIKRFIEDLYVLDITIKTKTVDVDSALQGYILSLKRQNY